MDFLVRMGLDWFLSLKKRREVFKIRDILKLIVHHILTPYYNKKQEEHSTYRERTQSMISDFHNYSSLPIWRDGSSFDSNLEREMLKLFDSVKKIPDTNNMGELPLMDIEKIEKDITQVLKEAELDIKTSYIMELIFNKKLLIKNTTGYYFPENAFEKRDAFLAQIDDGKFDLYLTTSLKNSKKSRKKG